MRSFALRARGLREISVSVGIIGFLCTFLSFGGAISRPVTGSTVHLRYGANTRFTMRSSME